MSMSKFFGAVRKNSDNVKCHWSDTLKEEKQKHVLLNAHEL